MSDYISKSALMESIRREVFVASEECFDLRNEIYGLIKSQPTLDEKEIIRKPFERAMERLEECFERYEDVEYYARLEESEETLDSEYAHGKKDGINEAIEIVKEECGINE